MKRLLAVLFGAMFLVVGTSGTALADELGAKGFDWPAHCGTNVVLYVHTWSYVSNVVDARMDVRTCSGSARASAIKFNFIVLYRNRRANGVDHISQLAYAGGRSFSLPNNAYVPIYSSPDVSCGFSNPVQLADDVWANAEYQIVWADGTKTSVRNNNSYATTIIDINQCR
jgi:hypothetical protein